MENTRPRYSLLDMTRGITLLSMIAYHAAYDLTYLYHVRMLWFRDDPGQIWQQSICWTFIFLSGMCFCLGRRPVKRGLLLTGCGIIITLATAFVMPDAIVIMGILSFFGLATLITALAESAAFTDSGFCRSSRKLPAVSAYKGSPLWLSGV